MTRLTNRNLILVTNNLDAVSYYVVGTLRLLLADPLFFLLGHWYGDTAIEWMERRTKTFGQMLRQMEGWFDVATLASANVEDVVSIDEPRSV